MSENAATLCLQADVASGWRVHKSAQAALLGPLSKFGINGTPLADVGSHKLAMAWLLYNLYMHGLTVCFMCNCDDAVNARCFTAALSSHNDTFGSGY